METATIKITGTMPLLMHADNIDWADMLAEWAAKPANKRISKAGDDRTPPWRWIGCLNWDDPQTGVVTIPSEYLMSCAMKGAAEVPTGRRGQTFKNLSQSGLLCSEFHFPLLVRGHSISMAKIQECLAIESYKGQEAAVGELGFSLFKKRAKVGASKHIRVRPRFDDWSLVCQMHLVDKQITKEILQTILNEAGRLKGLGDWRPGGKTPGPWGTFKAIVE